METTIVLFLSSLLLLLVFDGAWLVLMSKRFYSKSIGHLMTKKPNFIAIILFYATYLIVLNYLILTPAFELKQSYGEVFLRGLLFGLACYGTYDLTNQATLKKWPLKLTIVDIIWGSLLTASVGLGSIIISGQILA